jgi:hypothetical protein
MVYFFLVEIINILRFLVKLHQGGNRKGFDPIINKNGHHYMEFNILKIIARAKSIWIIKHQKPYVLSFKIITSRLAKGVVCKLQRSTMN